MTQTRIRIGQVAIDGVAHMASGAAFGKRLETAVAAALRQATAGAPVAATSLPLLRLTLPHRATEADVAQAVASALRDAAARSR